MSKLKSKNWKTKKSKFVRIDSGSSRICNYFIKKNLGSFISTNSSWILSQILELSQNKKRYRTPGSDTAISPTKEESTVLWQPEKTYRTKVWKKCLEKNWYVIFERPLFIDQWQAFVIKSEWSKFY